MDTSKKVSSLTPDVKVASEQVGDSIPQQASPPLTELQREFLETIESQLRKSEKETWLVHDHDHNHLVKK